MSDPKPYTEAEISAEVEDHGIDLNLNLLRVLATAQAAAEADSLRARLAEEKAALIRSCRQTVEIRAQLKDATLKSKGDDDEIRFWQNASFSREKERDDVRTQLEEARRELKSLNTAGELEDSWRVKAEKERDAYKKAKAENDDRFMVERDAARQERDEAEAALTAAQGEVAVLREALKFYADPGTYHACAFLFDRPTGGFDEDFDEGHDDYDRPMPGKRARAALTSTRATADAHDERVRREAIVWWINHGTIHTTTGEALRALAHPTKEP